MSEKEPVQGPFSGMVKPNEIDTTDEKAYYDRAEGAVTSEGRVIKPSGLIKEKAEKMAQRRQSSEFVSSALDRLITKEVTQRRTSKSKGRFCMECGTPLMKRSTCPACNTHVDGETEVAALIEEVGPVEAATYKPDRCCL